MSQQIIEKIQKLINSYPDVSVHQRKNPNNRILRDFISWFEVKSGEPVHDNDISIEENSEIFVNIFSKVNDLEEKINLEVQKRNFDYPVHNFNPANIIEYSKTINDLNLRIDYLNYIQKEYNQYYWQMREDISTKYYNLLLVQDKEFLKNLAQFLGFLKSNLGKELEFMTTAKQEITFIDQIELEIEYLKKKAELSEREPAILQNEIKKVEPEFNDFELSSETKLLRIDDLCKIFGVSRTTISSWIKKGYFKPHIVGRIKYFHPDEIKNEAKRLNLSSVKAFLTDLKQV